MIFLFLYLIYAVLILLAYYILKKKVHVEKRGMLLFGLILSIIFPVVGLILSIVQFSIISKYENLTWIDEYSNYVTFKIRNYEEIVKSAKQDMEIISFTSGLELDQPDLQKQLIVQLSLSPVLHEGKLLKEAVRHKDPETVHYAATTIHALNERYRKDIHYLKQEFSQNYQHESANELMSHYVRYIESGLLSSQQKEELIDEFIVMALQGRKHFPHEPIYQFHLGTLFMYKKEYQKAEESFTTLVQEYPESFYGYAGLLELYYSQRYWSKLYDLLDTLIYKNQLDQLPRKYQLFAYQFGGIQVEKEA
ncbi:hypothetical protein AB1283_17315 [Bacillus sp. S13(2024)]|uniref:tetratricopeptide repeat protein n=1 Tax=unclassified Bacillus (in: firmicutes) TaxID=185979 RepID=UPI003D2327C6